MLTNNNKSILKTELLKSTYNGMTAIIAYQFLYDPVTNVIATTIQPPKLKPLAVAALLGPSKSEAIASAFIGAFPHIAANLMNDGIDPANPNTVGFLISLKNAGQLTQNDLDLMLNPVTKTTNEICPPRAYNTFNSENIAKLRLDANVPIPSIDEAGFPNVVDFSDFELAWNEVRP